LNTHDLVANDIQGLVSGEGLTHDPVMPTFVASSAPLGSTVSSKLKTKIWADELESLVPGREYDFSVNVESNPDKPNNVLVTNNKTNGFKAFWDWEDVFFVYASIYMETYPSEGPGLLKHISLVKRLS
jgi:hypothetical protein